MITKEWINGKIIERIMSEQEVSDMQAEQARMEVVESSRPLTADEILRLTIRKQVNSLEIDNQTASRMVDYYPALSDYAEGELIKAGTKINAGGVLKQAAVDLYNYPTNSPDNAPTLWEDISYRDGIRVIPNPITSTTAFALDELGWQDGHIYRSGMDGNVYQPGDTNAPWTLVR